MRNISIVKRLATLRHVNRRTDERKDDPATRTEEYVRVIALLRPHTVTLFVTFAAVAAVVAAALVATGTGPPSVTFQEPGHWVYNRLERAAFHVDAGTRRVDARVDVPSSAGDPLMVLQDRRQGFVVARDAVSPIARAALTVGAPQRAARDEVPVGVEVVGGPYLVRPQAGAIERLGEPRTAVEVGGPVGAPVRTADGTVWVHRTDTGEVCALRTGAVTPDCATRTAPGAAGALTVVAGRPAWLDTTAGTLSTGDGAPVALGADLTGSVLVGDTDGAGRLPVVVPDRGTLVLADPAGGAPTVVDLGPGRYAAPAAAGDVVAVLDQDSGRLRTFGRDGALRGTAELAPGAVGPVRGEDGRLYVDDPQGTATTVVDPDGSATTVATGGTMSGTVARPAPALAAAGPAAAPATDAPDGPGVALPKAPTDVAVKRQGDVLTVAWRAPAGAVDHYTVVLNRAVVTTTTATSATLQQPGGPPRARRGVGDQRGRDRPALGRRHRLRRRGAAGCPGRAHARGAGRPATVRVRAVLEAARPRRRCAGALRGELDLREGCDGQPDDHRHVARRGRRRPLRRPVHGVGAGGDPGAGRAAAHRPPDDLHRHRATRHLRRADDARRRARRRRRDHRDRERRRRRDGPVRAERRTTRSAGPAPAATAPAPASPSAASTPRPPTPWC